MKKLNWGILGTGWIAHEMGEALTAVNGEIYAVCNVRLAGAQQYAEEFGVQKVYGSPDEMFADENVDIVYIATPHNLHYEAMLKALKAGKHVFCEKSITVNSRQLEECAALAEEKGLIICDGTTLLHMPLYKKLRQIIEEGAIGDVKMVQVNFGSCKEYDVNNRFFSKELAGGKQPDNRRRYFETGVDETSGIILKNPDGEMAVIALTMLGEKGFIEISDYPRAQRAVITYTEDGRKEVIEAGSTDAALQYEVRDMQEYILNKSGQENLRIVRDVMEVLTAVRNQWGLVYPFE